MTRKEIRSFKDYLDIVEEFSKSKHEIILYRGQTSNYPLIPSIARKDAKIDTSSLERQMLEELKRRSQLTLKTRFESDWEWLVYAQHFGMKTRLLDWTSNPLAALWFACANVSKLKDDSFVYIFTADTSFLIDTAKKETPFHINRTRILKPALNNERIVAQAGWFTAHKFSSTANAFVNLTTNKELKNNIIEVKIPSSTKIEALKHLNIFGINAQVLFPDISGICNHINWTFVTD